MKDFLPEIDKDDEKPITVALLAQAACHKQAGAVALAMLVEKARPIPPASQSSLAPDAG